MSKHHFNSLLYSDLLKKEQKPVKYYHHLANKNISFFICYSPTLQMATRKTYDKSINGKQRTREIYRRSTFSNNIVEIKTVGIGNPADDLRPEKTNNKVTIEDIYKVMTNHFVSKRSVFTERKIFYRVTKKSEENFDQFALRLRHLANIYEFNDIDDQIQHRVVAGKE
ncbi:hypothetical protein BpHYR1_046420 [Brachionus plicatilis]|uniref:Uncharacterized protein n=1 Tax=Brachionus plicatilis TaxID=10195 RepID=A0A3M7PQ77_BRAPC|nr:hypothetical protein BpHYR1_046420 [Brachionus plicatilis]